jgi:hypothetical protein
LTANGNVTFQPGATFSPLLDGSIGGDTEQLNVSGDVIISGAKLKPVLGLTVTQLTEFTILESPDPIVGQFNGLANGAIFTANGGKYQIIYTANTVAVMVLVVPTSLVLVSSPSPSSLGQTVTFTATVGTPPGTGPAVGTVSFMENGTLLGTATLFPSPSGGRAIFQTSTLALGTQEVQAIYAGNTSPPFAPSPQTPNSRVLQVVHKDGTNTTVTANANPSFVGQTITFFATVAARLSVPGTPTGMVTFMDGTKILGTAMLQVGIGGDVASFTIASLPVGSHSITAIYGGDSTFNNSISPSLTQIVNPRPALITRTLLPRNSVDAFFSMEAFSAQWEQVLGLEAGQRL